MDEEDKKYLRSEKKTRPSLEVFSGMVRILKGAHENIDKLLNKLNKSLLETFKTIV